MVVGNPSIPVAWAVVHFNEHTIYFLHSNNHSWTIFDKIQYGSDSKRFYPEIYGDDLNTHGFDMILNKSDLFGYNPPTSGVYQYEPEPYYSLESYDFGCTSGTIKK